MVPRNRPKQYSCVMSGRSWRRRYSRRRRRRRRTPSKPAAGEFGGDWEKGLVHLVDVDVVDLVDADDVAVTAEERDEAEDGARDEGEVEELGVGEEAPSDDGGGARWCPRWCAVGRTSTPRRAGCWPCRCCPRRIRTLPSPSPAERRPRHRRRRRRPTPRRAPRRDRAREGQLRGGVPIRRGADRRSRPPPSTRQRRHPRTAAAVCAPRRRAAIFSAAATGAATTPTDAIAAVIVEPITIHRLVPEVFSRTGPSRRATPQGRFGCARETCGCARRCARTRGDGCSRGPKTRALVVLRRRRGLARRDDAADHLAPQDSEDVDEGGEGDFQRGTSEFRIIL